MLINDSRSQNNNVTREKLRVGEVYVTEHGAYVLVTDSDAVVNLYDGSLSRIVDYRPDSEFTPTNARLEIY